jgi:hypothetical protein
MALVVDATVGGASANSYETTAEAQTYFDSRLTVDGWDNADSQDVLVVMATRVLDALAQPFKTFFPAVGGDPAYYRVRRQWTGAPATVTQRLAWPRIGMFDHNNNAIDPTTIPQALKDACAELAGQLGNEDRTLDNSVIVQGITSIKAGSVGLGFKQAIIPQVIPDAVYNLLPQSWLTDELYILANQAVFDVASEDPTRTSREYGW